MKQRQALHHYMYKHVPSGLFLFNSFLIVAKYVKHNKHLTVLTTFKHAVQCIDCTRIIV